MIELKKYPIANSDEYLNQMTKSFVDKSDFIQYLPPEVNTIIDFGCADGSFIKYLQNSFPQYTYFGIENNEEFLEKAKLNLEGRNVKIYHSLQDLYEECEFDLEHSHFNMSSVIHEIFAYENKPRAFLSNIFKIYNFESISIRDMNLFRKPIIGLSNNDRNSKSLNFPDNSKKYCYLTAFKNVIIKIMQKSLTDNNFSKKLCDFLKCNNSGFSSSQIVMEFLLKYFYDDNWERECRESYFIAGYDLSKITDVLNSYDYTCISKSCYTPIYLLNKWIKDFNLNNRDITVLNLFATHYKHFYRKLTDEELTQKYSSDGRRNYHYSEDDCQLTYTAIKDLSNDLEEFGGDCYGEACEPAPISDEVPDEDSSTNHEVADSWSTNPISDRTRSHQIAHLYHDAVNRVLSINENFITTNRIHAMNSRPVRYNEDTATGIPAMNDIPADPPREMPETRRWL